MIEISRRAPAAAVAGIASAMPKRKEPETSLRLPQNYAPIM